MYRAGGTLVLLLSFKLPFGFTINYEENTLLYNWWGGHIYVLLRHQSA